MSQNPTYHLANACDSVRDFNHGSLKTNEEWQYPGHGYDAFGNLSRLAAMLPQALEQAAAPVNATHAAGRLLIDGGGDPEAAMGYLREALNRAVATAGALNEAVAQLHAECSPMGLDIRGLVEFEDDEPHRD